MNRKTESIVREILCFIFVGMLFCAPGDLSLGACTPPVNISKSSQVAEEQQVAVDPAGNAVAVWRFFNGSNFIIQAATLPFGGSWTSPVQISTPGEDSRTPQVGVDDAGNAVAVWRGGNNIIQAATLPFGGSWTAPVSLSAAQPLSDPLPQVAVDPAGDAVAVWVFASGANNFIQAAKLPFGGSWTAAVNLSVVSTLVNHPQVAIDPSGNAVAVWERFNGSNFIIQAATLIPFSNGWSAPFDLSALGQNSFEAQVSLDAAGNAVIIWINSTTNTIQASTLPFNTGTPTSPVDIAPGLDSPQVAVDPAGNAVAVWFGAEGGNSVIFSSTLPFGGSWTTPVRISALGEDATSPQVVVDPAGDAVAVWSRFNGTHFVIQLAVLPFGETWTSPVNVSASNVDSFEPQLGIDDAGNVVVVWNRFNGTNFVVQASSCNHLFVPAPPSNFVGRVIENRFLTQTEIVHRLTWTPSQDPNVVGYHLYRNSKLIATIPARGPFVFDDRNRCKKTLDVYVLRSFDARGVESEPLTVILK